MNSKKHSDTANPYQAPLSSLPNATPNKVKQSANPLELAYLAMVLVIAVNVLLFLFGLFVSLLPFFGIRLFDVRSFLKIHAFLSYAHFGSFLTGVIAFASFLFFANKNARGFSSHRFRFSPWICFLGCLIPLVNLVLPLAAMKEIFRVGKQPHEENWAKVPARIVDYWWILFVFWLGISAYHSYYSYSLQSMQIYIVLVLVGLKYISLFLLWRILKVVLMDQKKLIG